MPVSIRFSIFLILYQHGFFSIREAGSPPLDHVAYHSQGAETKDGKRRRRTPVFAERLCGATCSDVSNPVRGETPASSSVGAPTLMAVASH
jgi:hypothetical protein